MAKSTDFFTRPDSGHLGAESQADLGRGKRGWRNLRRARIGDPAGVARRLMWECTRRADELPDVQLYDPQWMMLLELFIAHEEGRDVNVKTLALVSRTPSSTAARHIAYLEAERMIERRDHPADGRSCHLRLSPAMLIRVRTYLEELDRNWLAPLPGTGSN